jgi:hypothetical protein
MAYQGIRSRPAATRRPVVRNAASNRPRVAEARIEQPYITRAAGWKRRTIKRLRMQEVELVAEVEA